MTLGVLRSLLLPWLLALVAWPLAAQADVYDDVERQLRNGQLERAEQLGQKHLKDHPQDPQMRLLLSRIQDADGRPDQARETLQALTQDFPELPEPHNNLAVLDARQGRLQEALDGLQRALQVRPDYTQALENLGDLHLSLAQGAYLRASRTASPSASAAGKAKALAPVLPH